MANLIYDFFPVYDIVCSLLEKPFSTWRESDQIDAVKVDRPLVAISATKRKADDDGNYQLFKKSMYFRYPWLCGSTYSQNIHCWPCLLFAKESERWNCDAYFHISQDDIFDNHARQESHVTSAKKLEEFKKQKCKKEVNMRKIILVDNAKKNPLSEEKTSRCAVRMNRKCAELVVDTIMFMVKKQMPLEQEDESSPCSYADLFHILLSQSQNEELKNHFRKMKGCVNPFLTKSMLQAVVESVSECILEYIRDSVKEAKFFSLRVDDGLNESSECALFIRIVKPNNKLKEYFIGCYSLGSNENVLSLFQIVGSVLEKYEYQSKLVGICCDIACVKGNCLKELRAGMKYMAKQCTIVNLFGHCLDYTVEKCLRRIPACCQFFVNLSALFDLTRILIKRNYCPDSEDWRGVGRLKNSCCSKFKLLSAMLQDWKGMLNFFQEIQQGTDDLEDAHYVSAGTHGKLKDRQFIFLAVFLRHLFETTNALCQELKDNPYDPVLCQERVKHVCATLYTKRNDAFYEDIFQQADQIMTVCSLADESALSSEDDAIYKPLFYEMLDNLTMELHTRLENTDQHAYFEIGSLYQCKDRKKFVKDQAKIAKNCFPNIFKESVWLENELLTVHAHSTCYVHARMYKDLPISEAIYLLKGTRPNFFTHAYNLMTVITLQIPTAQQFHCLHEFSCYLKDSDIGLRPHLSNILMNEDILNEDDFSLSFKDEVLNKLSVKCDDIKLSYTEKSFKKQPENILRSKPKLVLGSESNLLRKTATPLCLSSAPGPSTRLEPDSSMMEQDVHLAMTCEVYPADEPQHHSLSKVKDEPVDPGTYKQGIHSASVMQELGQSSSTSNQDGSLFQPPALIKEEPVSFEEEL